MSNTHLDIFDIFKCTELKSLNRLMRKDPVLQARHFIRVTNAATLGVIKPIKCLALCRLLPMEWDMEEVLREASAGTLKSRKIRKIAGQLEDSNRHHLFMFYIDDAPNWWAFSFTLNDLEATSKVPHWRTAHIHLTTFLSHPLEKKEKILKEWEINDTPKISHDHHIPFEGYIGQDLRLG